MLKFAPLNSFIDVGFYTALAGVKIDHAKLDDSARKIVGRYAPGRLGSRDVARLEVRPDAFNLPEIGDSLRAEGIIKNVNTIEDFGRLDRKKLVEEETQKVWEAIIDGTIYDNPSLLVPFIILSFADLKKYKFTTLFAFPAFSPSPSWEQDGSVTKIGDDPSSQQLDDAIRKWQATVDWRQRGFFLAKKTSSGWTVGALKSYEDGFFTDPNEELFDKLVGFVDTCSLPDNLGWIARNLLTFVRYKWSLRSIRLFSYRASISESLIFPVKVSSDTSDPANALAALHISQPQPKVVSGWEKTLEGKLTPKVANLGASMDPNQLASQSVDLNLKLMRWRLAPGLDLEGIKDTKCLLLGAGTLGSYVSRILLGWGVRTITFIDNGNVSYSNPVRQPLFTFNDCIGGKTAKAPAAAEALKQIFPGVNATGIEMSVPMAGHPILDEESIKRDTERLEKLIDEHDAVFLLMDTRESRWLPTLLGKAKEKLVLTAALGFDSFVVMRHGVSSINEDPTALGCYFCNDVVAPADSLTDRTLDQQCTVTRPGIAPLASSLVVEMLVSLLQHPLKGRAPGGKKGDNVNEHILGLVPHQLRGYLSSWDTIMVQGQAYDRCSACSDKVIEGYRKDGWDFLKKALGEKGYVEEISGLAELKRQAEEASWDQSDEEDGWGEGDEEPEIL